MLFFRVVGAFLGKNGSTVNKVKEQTGVYVQFTKPGTAVNTERDRMLILASDTVEQAKQAITILLQGVMQVVSLNSVPGCVWLAYD